MNRIKELFKTKKTLILSLVTLVLTIGVGVSFAYFSANIGDPESCNRWSRNDNSL